MNYLHRIKTRLTAMLPSDPVHAFGMLCVYVLLCLPAAFVAWCAIDFGAGQAAQVLDKVLFPTVAALATVASVIVPYCALRLPIPPIMIVAGPSWIASIGHGWLSVAAYFADDLNIQRLGVQLAVLTFVVAASLLPSVPTLVRRLIDRVPSRSSA